MENYVNSGLEFRALRSEFRDLRSKFDFRNFGNRDPNSYIVSRYFNRNSGSEIRYRF